MDCLEDTCDNVQLRMLSHRIKTVQNIGRINRFQDTGHDTMLVKNTTVVTR